MKILILICVLFSEVAVLAQNENFVYDPTGRRDPFLPTKAVSKTTDLKMDGDKTAISDEKVDASVADPLHAFTLDQFKLMAILWDVKNPKALVLAPNGKVYTVLNKSTLGREGAAVESIREQEVRFKVPPDNVDNKKAEIRVIYLRH